MKDLPLASGRRIVKVFEVFGWKASPYKNHIVLSHPDKPAGLFISIPDHKECDRRLLKSELRKAGISVEDFCKAWNEL
jgi:predicted RNA binding protein YcfA (HicA-like mRNA interferase family)